MTTALQQRHGITEVREHPDGLLRSGLKPSPGVDAGLVTAVTLAFRPNPKADWLEATGGSIHQLTPETWASWLAVGPDPLRK